ncbi:MAG TPA: GNAT family N-acetyltransferase [Kofleriaceae bacterium]|nr:GNAT family N-acetyltransferase [Kofleriaceae bacterium]
MARSLQVLAYAPEWREAWDQHVAESVNGTLFHTRRFLGYHGPEKFADASAVLLDGTKLVCVVSGAWRVEADGTRVLVSHPGASYGGPVFRRKASYSLIQDAVAAWEQHAKSIGAGAIQTRLPPHVFHQVPLQELEFALRFRGFAIVRSELTSAATLDGDIAGRFSVNCRNQLRQAERAQLVAGESTDFEQFWQVLEANLSEGHGVTPTHTLADIQRLRELCPGAIRLFVASRDGRILAGTVLFVCNTVAVHTFYMGSRSEDRPLRPLNLALHTAMMWARDAGFQRINFGVSTPDPATVNSGLLHFKEGFGGRGELRDSYRKILV